MPIGLQQLQDFSSVSSVSQLKIDDAGNLSRRSGVGTFFQKVADAFRSLSQSGRAEIMARNTRIADALGRAVKDADAEPPAGENVPALRQRLGDVKNRISAAVQQMRQQATDDELVSALQADIRFKNLPEASRNVILLNLNQARQEGSEQLRGTLNMLTDLFFQHNLRSMDLEHGMQAMKDDFTNEFLKPSQQTKDMGADGFHVNFVKDGKRGCMSRIGNTAMPGHQEPEFYKTALRNFLGEENARFLPFVSMMVTQAGMLSAAVSMPQLAGNGSLGELTQLGLVTTPDDKNIRTEVTRDGGDILIRVNFTIDFRSFALEGSPHVLQLEGSAAMRINPDAEPRVQMVGDKQVIIPQFTMENAAMEYRAPQA
ncbi:MAG: hypothetical protein ACI4P0_02375 [Mailhella sp.]